MTGYVWKQGTPVRNVISTAGANPDALWPVGKTTNRSRTSMQQAGPGIRGVPSSGGGYAAAFNRPSTEDALE
jgi:hypothetical protein